MSEAVKCYKLNGESVITPGFDDLLALPSLPGKRFIYGNNPDIQFGELFEPDSPAKLPVIVMIHGGCWLDNYSLDHVRPLCTALAANGFPVWSIEYRRLGQANGGWPGTFEDAVSAVNFLNRLKSEAFPVKEVIFCGHSAGGHLALWLAALGKVAPTHAFYNRLNIEPTAVVGLAAISNMPGYSKGASSCENAASELLATLPSELDAALTLSPYHMDPHPRTLLLHGTIDPLVPLQQSEDFTKRHQTSFIQIPAAGHFDLIHPQTNAWQILVSSLKHLSNDN